MVPPSYAWSVTASFRCVFLLACALSAVAFSAAAAEDPANVAPYGLLDAAHRSVSSRLERTARWVDSFFEEPAYTEEEADARLSLRQSVKFSQENTTFRTRISGGASLPNLSGRVKVLLEGNDDLPLDDTDEEEPEDAAEEAVEAPSFALHYVFSRCRDVDFRMHAGVRLGDFSVYAGPRLRLQTRLGPRWRTRLTQRVRWYAYDGWRSHTDIAFYTHVGTRNLFRQSFSTAWQEDERESEGFRHTVASSFTQPLDGDAALRYAWSSVYLTRFPSGWRSTTLSAGYRARLGRDWIICEVKPFVSWEEARDWRTNVGATLSASVVFEQARLTQKAVRPE